MKQSNAILTVLAALILAGGCATTSDQPAATAPTPKPPVEHWMDAKGVHADYTKMAAPVGLNMTAAIGYEADEESIAKIKESLEVFSTMLWERSFGQMYLNKVILRNNSKDGYIHFEKLAKLGGHATFNGPFTVNTNLLDIDKRSGRPGVGVRVLAAGLLHEFGHSGLLLKDEYGTTSECIMHPQSRTSSFCANCEKELLERFKNWRFPSETDRAEWSKKNKKPVMRLTME